MGRDSEEPFDSAAVLEPVLQRMYAMSGSWELRDGQRLRGPRRAILRLLAPYVERQEELNDVLRIAVVLLSREVDRLTVKLEESSRQADSEGTVSA
jgi:hypothetical protein